MVPREEKDRTRAERVVRVHCSQPNFWLRDRGEAKTDDNRFPTGHNLVEPDIPSQLDIRSKLAMCRPTTLGKPSSGINHQLSVTYGYEITIMFSQDTTTDWSNMLDLFAILGRPKNTVRPILTRHMSI